MIPEKIHRAFARNAEMLLGKENVVLVGKGKKWVAGKETSEDAIIVLVTRKRPLELLRDPVPKTVYTSWYSWDTVPTDVIEKGTIKALPWGKIKARETVERFRPAMGGCSIGNFKISAGTLGVVASHKGKKVIYSNHHVLTGGVPQLGDAIYQPGPYDGGKSQDAIGSLSKWVPIMFDGSENQADAAIAAPFADSDLALGIMKRSRDEIVIPTGLHGFQVGEAGWKRGRTTDYTELRCLAVDATVKVDYGNGIATFVGCDVFDPPGASAGGDSGSVIMFGDRMGSHLFAGSDQVTIGTPIAKAFELLDLQVALPEVPEEPAPPEPEPPVQPGIEPVELLVMYLDGKVQLKATIAVEDGQIVIR